MYIINVECTKYLGLLTLHQIIALCSESPGSGVTMILTPS